MGHYVEAGKTCPNCGREYRAELEFCTHCSTELSPVPVEIVVVRQCVDSPDHPVNPEDKFCGRCGGRVVEVEEERPEIVLVIGPDPRVIG